MVQQKNKKKTSELAVFQKGECIERWKWSYSYLSLGRPNDLVDVNLYSLFGIGVVAVLVVLDEVKVVVGLLVTVSRDLLVQDVVQLEWKNEAYSVHSQIFFRIVDVNWVCSVWRFRYFRLCFLRNVNKMGLIQCFQRTLD